MRRASLIWSKACVVSPVPGFNSIDGEHANFLSVSRYQNSIVCRQIKPYVVSILVKLPPNFDRQIAFCDGASCRYWLVKVQLLLTEWERKYRGQNFSIEETILKLLETNCKFRIWILGNFFYKISRTVNGKISGMLRKSAFIRSEASVVPSMPCFDRLNRQHADFLTVSWNHNSVVRRQVVTNIIGTFAESPPNLNRQIAFGYRAHRRNWFVEIQLFFPKREWNNRGKNLKENSENPVSNKLQNFEIRK